MKPGLKKPPTDPWFATSSPPTSWISSQSATANLSFTRIAVPSGTVEVFRYTDPRIWFAAGAGTGSAAELPPIRMDGDR